nr:hypothetical protein 14 [Candidatus Omnitrophota bacterium]
MKIIHAPKSFERERQQKDFVVFQAGSIEMGTAVDWQTKMSENLKDLNDLIILNPRRPDWDSSWEQTIENPNFRQQVEWELDAMFFSHLVAMYFDPETKSPITLLELGLLAGKHKLVVCCPDGFWRKGNVDIVCRRYSVPQVDNLDALNKAVRDAYIIRRHVLDVR